MGCAWGPVRGSSDQTCSVSSVGSHGGQRRQAASGNGGGRGGLLLKLSPTPPTPRPTVREQPLHQTRLSWGFRWGWSKRRGLKAGVLLRTPLIQSPPRGGDRGRCSLRSQKGPDTPLDCVAEEQGPDCACRAPGAVLGASPAPHARIRPAGGLWNRGFKSVGLTVDSAVAS